MPVTPPGPEDLLRDALAALHHAETLVLSIDRHGILQKLDDLRDFVEEVSRLQLDIRIVRLRLQASLSPENDPDKTPTHSLSSDKLRSPTVTKK